MRRSEGELVAISPPPEFRDSGTPLSMNATLVVPLPPPPKDFRDLTPSPGGFVDPLLTFGLTPHTLPPLQSFHHGQTFIRKTVWDFADRVSLSIISEAVVIATVFPEAGSRRDTRFTKGGEILKNSRFEEKVLRCYIIKINLIFPTRRTPAVG